MAGFGMLGVAALATVLWLGARWLFPEDSSAHSTVLLLGIFGPLGLLLAYGVVDAVRRPRDAFLLSFQEDLDGGMPVETVQEEVRRYIDDLRKLGDVDRKDKDAAIKRAERFLLSLSS